MLEVFVKVQYILEARLGNIFLTENYLRHQMSFTTTTRAHDRNERMRVRIFFFVHAFGPGMMYPTQADSNASTPEW